jgi:hypothetical protein
MAVVDISMRHRYVGLIRRLRPGDPHWKHGERTIGKWADLSFTIVFKLSFVSISDSDYQL